MILNDLRKNITDVLNQSGLSIDAIYFVMKDVMNEIVDIYNQQVKKDAEMAAQESLDEIEGDESAAAANKEA